MKKEENSRLTKLTSIIFRAIFGSGDPIPALLIKISNEPKVFLMSNITSVLRKERKLNKQPNNIVCGM